MLKKLTFFCISVLLFQNLSHAQINYYEFFSDNILRIDYERRGSIQNENISEVAFLKEELWSGCRTKTIEPYDYGDYKIEVRIPENNQLLYNFSYSSLFAEYIYTTEGADQSKKFEETVRLPYPVKPVKIAFLKRKKTTNDWILQYEILFDPSKTEVSNATFEKEVLFKKLVDSGNPAKKADIVFVADGYTEEQTDKFFNDAIRISEYVLNCIPFNEHKDKFNIWAVFVASEDEGITDPVENRQNNTALGTNFSTFDTDRYLMTEHHFTLRNIVSVVPYDHIIIVANSNKYGGGGIYNFYATCPSDDIFTDFLVVHEFGHSFAGLADEYGSDGSVIDYYNLQVEPPEPNITTLIDFQSKWQHMVEDDVPVPTPSDEWKYRKKVGAFEGAGYSQKGIYRPVYDCTMRSVKYNDFCPVCQQAITNTILFFSE